MFSWSAGNLKSHFCVVQIGTLSDHNEELMKLKHAGPWSKFNCDSYLEYPSEIIQLQYHIVWVAG